MSQKNEKEQTQVVGLFGVGFDNQDGHQRYTKSKNFLLLGGSKETHENMQEIAIKFDEALDKRGKRLQEAPVHEVIDLLNEAAGK